MYSDIEKVSECTNLFITVIQVQWDIVPEMYIEKKKKKKMLDKICMCVYCMRMHVSVSWSYFLSQKY